MNVHGKSVVLVTTTFYPSTDDMRYKLALKTVQEAKRCGYEIIVVDGSKDAAVGERFVAEGAILLKQTKPGMGRSREQCLRAALEALYDVIVWLEPEKWSIVAELARSIELVALGKCDMVIPRRKVWDNYPTFQRDTELWANHLAANITGRPDLDLWIGPRVMNRQATEEMSAYKGERGDNWEILFVPVIRMLAKGFKIWSVFVLYIHPIEQSVEDDQANREKRLKQFRDLLRAMQDEADAQGWKPPLEGHFVHSFAE